MTVYVDPISNWPTAIRCFEAGSCHLIADTVDELHAFAKRLGLRRGWFQPSSWPHYDLTPARREKAIQLGAVEKTARELAEMRIAWRSALQRSGPASPPAEVGGG